MVAALTRFWYLDALFVKIQGRQRYLWRAVDEDRDVIDILVPPHVLSGQLQARSYRVTVTVTSS